MSWLVFYPKRRFGGVYCLCTVRTKNESQRSSKGLRACACTLYFATATVTVLAAQNRARLSGFPHRSTSNNCLELDIYPLFYVT